MVFTWRYLSSGPVGKRMARDTENELKELGFTYCCWVQISCAGGQLGGLGSLWALSCSTAGDTSVVSNTNYKGLKVLS